MRCWDLIYRTGFLLVYLFFGTVAIAGNISKPVKLFVEGIENNRILRSSSRQADLQVGQNLAIRSQSPDVGLIGFVRIKSIQRQPPYFRIEAELIRSSSYNFVQIGDELVSFDLSSHSEDYKGGTELLVRENAPQISARFKPLFTQGIAIGETAQTLWQKELLVTWYGQLHYGLVDWLSVGTLATASVFNSPNISLKAKFIDTASTSLATGVSFAKVPDGNNRWLVNWNLMWDSFTRENTISHTFATLAIYSIERAEDTTAIKAAGTSSFQTGYEVILGNWSRILFGPNYNFETKAVGGYLAYAKIWDHFHLQGTLYSTNVRNVKWSVTEGYFVYLDAYWRF